MSDGDLLQTSQPGPVIQTDRGRVQGLFVNGVHCFLGIPYAEAPFGQHRFLPPDIRSSWDGVLDTSNYGLDLSSDRRSQDCDEVATRMRKRWVNFARNGDPSTADFHWPEYDLETRKTTTINNQFSVLEDPYQQQRQVLNELMTMNWRDHHL